MYYTALFSVLFLLVGGVVGWMAAEKYIALLLASQQPPHEFQDLIDNNPHPELFIETWIRVTLLLTSPLTSTLKKIALY